MPFVQLNDIAKREVVPGCWARFVHGDQITLSYWNLEPSANIPAHSHPHEQVTTLIEGKMELTVDGEMKLMTPGCVWTIPGGVEHSVRALEECYVIDAFWPVREDYRG